MVAHAAPSARFIYVRGKGTETCPSETDVREAVRARLGYEPFSIFATSTMFAEVTSAKGGFVANLKLVDAGNTVRGDRVLEVRGDCAELMDAMALTISIAIDPKSIMRDDKGSLASSDATPAQAPASDEPPVPQGPAIAAPPPMADPASEPTAPATAAAKLDERPTRAAFVSLGPLVSLGSAPSLSVGGTFGIEGRIGRLAGGIEGRADLPSSASADGLSRVESSLRAGTLFAGVREGAFFATGVILVGQISATSTGVTEPKDSAALVAATGARAGVAVPLTDRLEARVRGEVLANLTRHTLELDGRKAFEYPAALGSVSVGVALRIW